MKKEELLNANSRITEFLNIELPFSVRSVGHYIVNQDWMEDESRYCDFIQLYWCISGTGCFIMNGKEHLLQPGFVCFYRRGDQHRAQALTESWNYRWFTFDGKEADAILNGFAYSVQPFFAGPCPEYLFIKMTEEICDLTPFGLRKIGITAYDIMTRVGGVPQYANRNDQLVMRCIELIKENFDEPETGINLLAEELEVHRSTLNRAFKDKIKMSPIKYLTAVRVQNALRMLRQTSLPVAEIGKKNGYNDPCYFSKVIKKAIGVSPELFRLKEW